MTMSVVLAAMSCNKKEVNPYQPVDYLSRIEIIVPEVLEVEKDSRIAEFEVTSKYLPRISDKLTFESGSTVVTAIIKEVSSEAVSFLLPSSMSDGRYSVRLTRSNSSKVYGETNLRFITNTEFTPAATSTVYGKVVCGDKALSGVVVSDGYLVTTTNENGYYELASKKAHGYVFISVPSGFEAPSDGIRPLFFATLNASGLERADFKLKSVNQDRFKLLVFGDQHLANRTNDVTQYRRFINDVNKFTADHPGERFYGLTLGDMTWDLYWYDNKFCFPEYLALAKDIKNLQIYHTIGNHDHDMAAAGDFQTVVRYKKEIGPTYYSYNLGKWHIVVLDNIECTNPGSGTTRTYNVKLVNEELEWLQKDIAKIPADMPVIVTMHAPVFLESGAERTTSASQMISILKGRQVHYYTGHTHVIYNVDKLSASNTFEHNSGAVCATWWWSGNETPGVHVAQDGAPGGYMVVDIDGTDMKWQFKATDAALDYQFRAYDGNSIDLSASQWCPSATGTYLTKYESCTTGWTVNTNNYVYLNVWNYDPKWKVEVTEGGKSLPVTKISAMDPLHVVSYSAQRANKNKTITFATEKNSHMFRVQASGPGTTLEIKVTDRFGNVYRETMSRPRTFAPGVYKLY